VIKLELFDKEIPADHVYLLFTDTAPAMGLYSSLKEIPTNKWLGTSYELDPQSFTNGRIEVNMSWWREHQIEVGSVIAFYRGQSFKDSPILGVLYDTTGEPVLKIPATKSKMRTFNLCWGTDDGIRLTQLDGQVVYMNQAVPSWLIDGGLPE